MAPDTTRVAGEAVDIGRLLGELRLPAMAAPMSGVSTPGLVAEACRAGIIGAFPTSNARSSGRSTR